MNNVLLAFENLHANKKMKRGYRGLMFLKFNMNKAYDRVE